MHAKTSATSPSRAETKNDLPDGAVAKTNKGGSP